MPLNRPCTILSLPILATALAATALLSGCSANFAHVDAPVEPVGQTGGSTAIAGSVFGGQQPVSGATVQLWVAGTTGYGTGATALGAAVKTNSDGGFTLGSYTCPAGAYVYITAAGGDPQIGSGSPSNSAMIALATALGPCSGLSNSSFIQINEVTTVAAVWALAPFAKDALGSATLSTSTTSPAFNVGTSSSNTQGLANAMAVAGNLASVVSGQSPGNNTAGTATNVEFWQVNALADILALCVNSTGATGATCSPVISSLASSGGGTAPADTLQIATYLAQNPTKSTGLLAQVNSTAPFQPYSSSVSDWTLGYSVPVAGTGTRFVAIDAFGNAWIAGNTYAIELDPAGDTISASNGYTLSGTAKTFGTAYQVAVDTANNAWFTDQTGNVIVGFTGSIKAGGANGGATYAVVSTPATVTSPGTATEGIAVDGNNNVWYATSGGHLYELPSPYTTPVAGATTTSLPYGVAVDLSNKSTSPNYTASNGGSFVYDINNNGCSGESLGGGTTGYGGSIVQGYTIASSGETVGEATPVTYIGNAICNTTSKVSTITSTYNGSAVTDNFMSTPAGLAVDNGNNLWIVNQNYVTSDTSGPHYSLTKATQNYSASFTAAAINSELTYSNISGGGLNSPWYIAIDGNGAAWVANGIAATTATATQNSYSNGIVSAFSNAGTPLSTTGFYGGSYNSVNGTVTTTYKRALIASRGIAVDGSGNVWTTNSSTYTFPGTSSATAFVTVTVGAATPTVTPLAKGIANDTLGTEP